MPHPARPGGKHPPGLKSQLAEILRTHNSSAAKLNKIVSRHTQEQRAQILYQGFEQLKALGYPLKSPHNLKPKHVEVLARHWEEKNLSAAAIQKRLSVFRVFCQWIGKPGMVGESASYVADPASVKRHYAATEDKSWGAKGIDFEAIAARAEEIEPMVGIYIRLWKAFGLRMQESYMLKPHRADKGAYLAVTDGTKGGRDRTVPITTEYQRAVLEEAKARANGVDSPLRLSRDRTLKQTRNRVYYVLRKLGVTRDQLGVTAHGLRHEFANDFYEEKAGAVSPLRRRGQEEKGEGEAVSYGRDEAARLHTTEALGHSRKGVTSAYLGAILNVTGKRGA